MWEDTAPIFTKHCAEEWEPFDNACANKWIDLCETTYHDQEVMWAEAQEYWENWKPVRHVGPKVMKTDYPYEDCYDCKKSENRSDNRNTELHFLAR